MIQRLREQLSGVVAIALITLIAIPLAFFGIDSFFMSSTRITEVGSVNGETITDLELQREINAQQNRLIQLLGENFDPAQFDTELLRPQAIQSLIERKLFLSEAKSGDMGVPENFVAGQIANMQQFQVDGQFSDVVFRNFLNAAGYTATSFLDTYAEDIIIGQLVSGVSATTLVTDKAVDSFAQVAQQTRSYEYVRMPVGSVLDGVEVSGEEVSDYYQQNIEQFRLPERLVVDYVELSLTNLLDSVEVSEADVSARYALMQADQKVERRASHILLEASDGWEQTAAEIQSRLDAGESFADLATEYSVDIGSANSGGDLGFTEGDTFPPEFENALANLTLNTVSPPVQTDAGIHLIQLTELREPELDLESEAENIEALIRRELAEEEFQRLMDQMQELAFATDNLQQLQESMPEGISLDIQTSMPFSRNEGSGIANSAAVRSIAFGGVVLEDQLNSELVQIDETRAIVVHLNERIPSQNQPLAEVSDQIRAALSRDKATSQLAEVGQQLLTEAQEGKSLEDIARQRDIEWQVNLSAQRINLDEVGQRAFNIPVAQGLPAFDSFSLGNGDFAVVKVTDAKLGGVNNLSAAQLENMRLGLAQTKANLEWQAYTSALSSSADIDLKVSLPEPSEI